ncbi:Reticuline oxidase [Triticum urartu]|uniref:Reticuline oxidase n=1 Tax=Triticum urartu TaxID=4572 RepID=M8A9I6_TRIUA|nr:Reticuline oxidase [Triticum urartu]
MGRRNLSWAVMGQFPTEGCKIKTSMQGLCGPNSYCVYGPNDRLNCECPSGYSYVDSQLRYMGCTQGFMSQSCDEKNRSAEFGVVKLPNTTWGNSPYEGYSHTTEDQCADSCLKDCLCAAAMYDDSYCAKMVSLAGFGRQGGDVAMKALIKAADYIEEDAFADDLTAPAVVKVPVGVRKSFLSVHLVMASSDDFLQCVRDKIPGELVYTQCSSSFSGVLLYYAVAKNNPRLAFPSGECPTIGVGGHFSGGGIGMMMRKYGLSIDRVVDAKLVNANGELLDRAGMGEDLFWAIRGGGGGNFGVVLSWKAVFRALYLGECGSLASTMRDRFPELNMTSADCQPMTWLQSAALSFFSFTNSKPVEDVLLPRPASPSTFSKGKSDYVRQAIPKAVWKEVYASWFTMKGAGVIVLEPHGGYMCGVPEDATPYPHRRGVLYVIQYIAYWMSADGGPAATSWLDGFYGFMAHHVTKHPREAYVNFRDLDIGQNALEEEDGLGAAENARFWGQRYFLGNYEKLAKVKAAVDPTNFFRNEQSIPPMRNQPRE